MSLIGLVNSEDGTNKTLEDALSLMSVATSSMPVTFEPTEDRGALAIAPSSLPSDPTPGTMAVDIEDDNMLKWWNGDEWVACSTEVISGGGGSGIGGGQTINLQQGLAANVTIATSGPLTEIVANDPLPMGLILNESSGQITGVPEVSGSFSVSMTATFSDATVATDDVGFSIAAAFPVTFTFNESTLASLAEGESIQQFQLTHTPYPNALPITWNIQGLPDGLWYYTSGTNNNNCYIYGEPQNTGTYQVTVSATNWAGTTTKTFDIQVYAYNMVVSGTSSFDGTYVPVDTGYYTYNYSGSYVDGPQYGVSSSWASPVRLYENNNNSAIKLFFYEPYAAWVLADMNSFDGMYITHVRPMGSYYNSSILPPNDGWFSYDTVYIEWTVP